MWNSESTFLMVEKNNFYFGLLVLGFFVAHAGLELAMTLLPQPPKCWHYTQAWPHPAKIMVFLMLMNNLAEWKELMMQKTEATIGTVPPLSRARAASPEHKGEGTQKVSCMCGTMWKFPSDCLHRIYSKDHQLRVRTEDNRLKSEQREDKTAV